MRSPPWWSPRSSWSGGCRDVYAALHLAEGQLEALTGIAERRWWEEGHRLSDGAIAAARRALVGVGCPAGPARRRDLRRRLSRVLRAGDGLPRGLGPGRRPGGGGLRRQQRLPGRPQRDGRGRQPDRGRPGPRRAGRGLRGLARDQRDRDRATAREAHDGLLQAVAGDPDRRLGRRGRAPDRRLVRDFAREEAHRRRLAHGPAAPRPLPMGDRVDRLERVARPTSSSPRPTPPPSRRTASSWARRPGAPSCRSSAGRPTRSTR